MDKFYLYIFNVDDFNYLYNMVDKVVNLIEEVISYRRYNFIEKLFVDEICEDTNLKYARDYIQLAKDRIWLLISYHDDVIYFTSTQSEELLRILSKLVELEIIIDNFEEFIYNKNLNLNFNRNNNII